MTGRKRQDVWTMFFSHVTPGRMDECWIWHGGKRGRYGSGWLNGKRQGAHQVAYQLFVGEIPNGMEVMHECDTPLCVNPSHLKLGTHLDNMRDAAAKHRMKPPRGEDVAISKLTADQVREIRQMKDNGYSHRVIGAKFGVSNVAIFKIVHGLMWAHLDK